MRNSIVHFKRPSVSGNVILSKIKNFDAGSKNLNRRNTIFFYQKMEKQKSKDYKK